MPLLTVIMPAHNAEGTVLRAIGSVLETPRRGEIEVVVVDDCSSDGTYSLVDDYRRNHTNIVLRRTETNSGGPSAPRNIGLGLATGEFVTFVDDDDWVDAGNMLEMADYAKRDGVDFLKGYLTVVSGESRETQNRIPAERRELRNMAAEIISRQSMTSDTLIRRSVVAEHGIRYATDIRIGEDTVFFLSVMRHCENVAYIDLGFLYYVKDGGFAGRSSTQMWGDREVNHQLTAWERAERTTSEMGLSYFSLRLPIGLTQMLLNLVQLSDGIAEETFLRLHRFVDGCRDEVRPKLALHSRYGEVYDAILAGDYDAFLGVSRRRLLIAGDDLKFALPLLPHLSKWFDIKVDAWKGHAAHDEKASYQYAEWADIIWCEWLLDNAVFYSGIVKRHQRMFIRAHRFELWRDAGSRINYGGVTAVAAVGLLFFERFQQRFSIPRAKMRLLPNYVETDIYSEEKTGDAAHTIGLVGAVPARKGLMRAYRLLKLLRGRDERFRLMVMGMQPREVGWILRDTAEKTYYDAAEEYLDANGLRPHVSFGGYLERPEIYREIGYVLSLSDSEAPESFHLAPAEGAAAGSMGLFLRWEGVEFLYPDWCTFDSVEDMADEIVKASEDPAYFSARREALAAFVRGHYSLELFIERFRALLDRIFFMGR